MRLRYQVRGLAAAVLALAAACPHSRAQAADRWYVAASVTGSGLDKPHQTIANAPTPGATLSVVNDVDFGWGGRFAAGRALGPFRLEGEIGRTENKSKAYSAVSPISATLPQDGHTDATRYMLNAYYELSASLPVALHVGAGVGAADVTVKTFAAPARAPQAPPSQLLDYTDTVFAWQLMAGFSRPISEHLSLEAQYRWFDAGEAKGKDARGERATRKMKGHNFDVGVRYAF
jgi:opacity protein-like surface antigen